MPKLCRCASVFFCRIPALVVVLGLAVSLSVGMLSRSPVALAQEESHDEQAVAQARSLATAFRQAAKKVLPTVVKVRTTSATQIRDPLSELFGNPGLNGDRPQLGLGSGVIIDSAGVVLTNHHVIQDASTVTIQLPDGREFPATEVKSDPDSDLAVVRFDPGEPLGPKHVARLGDSERLDIGDWVIAVGNPFELEGTVSAGIISAKGRTLRAVGRARFLQTDAAINPGNSGGPLVDLNGEVIGINTAIFSRSGAYQGIGFAIPVNSAKWVANQLLDSGQVQRAYIGVSIDQIYASDAEALDVVPGRGVLVRRVFPESPAEQAGLAVDDVILEFDGVPVSEPSELQEVVERADLQREHEMVILRDGQRQTLAVQVEIMPDADVLAQRLQRQEESAGPKERHYDREMGLMITDFDASLAAAAGVSATRGVMVINVDVGKPAYRAGLRSGMVIIRAGKERVDSVAELRAALEVADAEEGLALEVVDRTGRRILVLKSQAQQ